MATDFEGNAALTAVLAEYNSLRSEMEWLIDHGAQLQNYAIGLTVGVFPVAAFVLQNSSATFLIGLLLVLPVALSLLGLLFFRQHQEVFVIAAYIREQMRPIVWKMTGAMEIWGWEEFKSARHEHLSRRSATLGVWRPRTILLLRLAIFLLPAVCALLVAISLAIAQGFHRIHSTYTTMGTLILAIVAVLDVAMMGALGFRFWQEGDLSSMIMNVERARET